MKELWIVGYQPNFEKHLEWEFCGAFENKEDAINACRDIRYFIAPFNLNECYSDINLEFKDTERPNNKDFYKWVNNNESNKVDKNAALIGDVDITDSSISYQGV